MRDNPLELPRRPNIIGRVRAMEKGENAFFASGPSTVRSIVARVRAQHRKRKYVTESQDGGVRVWRLT